MDQLDLTAEQLLTTTRAVRKRLDLMRPVPRELIVECARIAMQAPAASNNSTLQFLVVTDPDKRRAIGEVYAKAWSIYSTLDGVYIGSIDKPTDELRAQQARSTGSAAYLAEHLAEVPAIVIGCHVGGRLEGLPGAPLAAMTGNVLPAMWSFMLAARLHGLGTCWTTLHLFFEQEVADICGIPFEEVQQLVLTPVAYTVGTDFAPVLRPDPETLLRWDTW